MSYDQNKYGSRKWRNESKTECSYCWMVVRFLFCKPGNGFNDANVFEAFFVTADGCYLALLSYRPVSTRHSTIALFSAYSFFCESSIITYKRILKILIVLPIVVFISHWFILAALIIGYTVFMAVTYSVPNRRVRWVCTILSRKALVVNDNIFSCSGRERRRVNFFSSFSHS